MICARRSRTAVVMRLRSSVSNNTCLMTSGMRPIPSLPRHAASGVLTVLGVWIGQPRLATTTA